MVSVSLLAVPLLGMDFLEAIADQRVSDFSALDPHQYLLHSNARFCRTCRSKLAESEELRNPRLIAEPYSQKTHLLHS